jgi:hypothetical protein
MTSTPDSNADVTSIARGYIRCADVLSSSDWDPDEIWSPETNPDQRAYEIIDAAIRGESAARAWELVVAILRESSDARLAHHASGPLEDLVRLRGAELIEPIEHEARRDQRFRRALGRIWLRSSALPEDVVRRLVAASGGAIDPT